MIFLEEVRSFPVLGRIATLLKEQFHFFKKMHIFQGDTAFIEKIPEQRIQNDRLRCIVCKNMYIQIYHILKHVLVS